MNLIRINGKYKWELTDHYCHILDFRVTKPGGNKFCALYPWGLLNIQPGYQFDGVTCFPDFPKMLPAACVHDALIQLNELGLCTRLQADREFKLKLLQDGVNRIFAEICFRAVRAYSLLKYRI